MKYLLKYSELKVGQSVIADQQTTLCARTSPPSFRPLLSFTAPPILIDLTKFSSFKRSIDGHSFSYLPLLSTALPVGYSWYSLVRSSRHCLAHWRLALNLDDYLSSP